MSPSWPLLDEFASSSFTDTYILSSSHVMSNMFQGQELLKISDLYESCKNRTKVSRYPTSRFPKCYYLIIFGLFFSISSSQQTECFFIPNYFPCIFPKNKIFIYIITVQWSKSEMNIITILLSSIQILFKLSPIIILMPLIAKEKSKNIYCIQFHVAFVLFKLE